MSNAAAAARIDAVGEQPSTLIDALFFSLSLLACAGSIGCWLTHYATTLG